jgi:predicted dienelactone hydrolase
MWKPKKRRNLLLTTLAAFTCGMITVMGTATSSKAAQKIEFDYPPFGEFDISVEDLDIFAREGRITNNFAFYANRVPKERLAQLRELMRSHFQLSPVLVSQFTYSVLGAKIVRRLGDLLLTETGNNGFYALRSALILSATDPEGVNIVNIIRRYPSDSIRINIEETQAVIGSLAELLKKRDILITEIKKLADAEASQESVDFSQQPDLRKLGTFSVTKEQTRTLTDEKRQRSFDYDLYFPQSTGSSNLKSPFPLIVISHGVAEDKETFAYLAQHLTSYGFAVAILEHPGSDAKKIQQYISGLGESPKAEELINRPLDVKFLLDNLESDAGLQTKINFQQIGAVGHSYGGYTTLTLAGATIDFEQVRKVCNPNKLLNPSSFLQCRADELLDKNNLPNIQDPRIKAVIALNPLSSVILGQKGLSKIQVPVMMVGGSQDIITPTVPEQIRPYTWLKTPNKYLTIIENGTHFSVSEKVNSREQIVPVPPTLIGPNPAIAQTYIKALSVAFFQTHLANQQQYKIYLSPGYGKSISQEPLNLYLLPSFTVEQFKKIYEGS